MPETVTLFFEFSIVPENLDRLKEVWDREIPFMENSEPGTLVCNWNVSDDGTKVCLLQHFKDTEAVLFHSTNSAAFSAEMRGLWTVDKVVVLGRPSKELIAVIKERNPATFYEEYNGFTR